MVFILAAHAQEKQADCTHWEQAGELPGINGHTVSLGFAGPVTGVDHDFLVVAGGANFPGAMPWRGGGKKYYDEGYLLKKNRVGKLHVAGHFRLPFALAYSASCSTPAGIVAAGGENANGVSRKALLIHWDAVEKKMTTGQLPDLPLPLTNAAITADHNIVYLAGGETGAGVSDRFFYLDLNRVESGWQELPALPRAVSHTVLVVQCDGANRYVYLVGGRRQDSSGISELYAKVYAFDLAEKKWQEKKSLPYALSAGTGIAAGQGEILLFGGDRGETFHKTEMLIAAIKKEKDETIKTSLNEEKARLQESHPGFSKTVLQYNSATDEWAAMGSIPFDTPVTTNAVRWGRQVLIPSGEIKAGVRTSQVLSMRLVSK